MTDIVVATREKGYVTTLLGRRRSFPEINVKDRTRREFAERMAINTPIQGTAADIIKLAMIRCSSAIRAKGLAAKMLLQIHDELVFELPRTGTDPVDRSHGHGACPGPGRTACCQFCGG